MENKRNDFILGNGSCWFLTTTSIYYINCDDRSWMYGDLLEMVGNSMDLGFSSIANFKVKCPLDTNFQRTLLCFRSTGDDPQIIHQTMAPLFQLCNEI